VFEVGETVVYPPHGAGRIERRASEVVLGEEREYLTILVLHTQMTLKVPADGALDAGVRPVMDGATFERVRAVLDGDIDEPAGPFSRRFRHNRERLRAGDVVETAEVIRNLSLRDRVKPLSSGERQMLAQARRVLASELACVRGSDEDGALAWLDSMLERPRLGVDASA
jgi:CarD family transcriptional regulator